MINFVFVEKYGYFQDEVYYKIQLWIIEPNDTQSSYDLVEKCC